MEKITPMPGKVWIKLDPMTVGGITLQDTNLVKEQGTVVGVGEGINFLKENDQIYFKAWGLDHIQIDGEDFYVADMDSKCLLGKRNV